MARTRSSGSTMESCQTAATCSETVTTVSAFLQSPKNGHQLPTQLIWGLRLTAVLQMAAIIHHWPVATSSPATVMMFATAALLVALSVAIRPHSDDTDMESWTTPAPAFATKTQWPHNDTRVCPSTPSITNTRPAQPTAQPGSRRNAPPVRASVAPLAAPNAVLARDLDSSQQALADLMARMSHDLRTPLNAVIGFSDLMQRETFGPLGSPQYQEYARHIQDCGTALLKSTEDTLAMTSALTGTPTDAPQHKPVAIEPLANEARQRLLSKANAQTVTINIDVAPELEVHAEYIALRQIILNLMEEALAHTQPGGQIFVQASTNGNRVTVEIGADTLATSRSSNTLPICIARTLLQLHKTQPVIQYNETSGWRALTTLERASQHDFFSLDAPPCNIMSAHCETDLVAA